MKVVYIVFAVIFSALFLKAIMSYASNKSTERQKYTLEKEEDGFEIRYYHKAIMATVVSKGGENQNRNNNFRRLAGYIFGGNQADKQIAMTAPVYMETENGDNKMSFVLPAQYNIDDLPKPKDGNIELHYSEDGYYAALRFSGYAGEKKIAQKEAQLLQLLQKTGYKIIGTFKYLGYNAPWDIINRENDVIVKVQYQKNK
jgi:SOUL heme-binding protein